MMIGRLFEMGARNLTRNPRRTAITVVALGGGLALSCVGWALMDGFSQESIDAMVGGSSGHLVVQPVGQLDAPNLYDTLDPGPVLAALDADPHVVGAVPHVDIAALVATDDDTAFVSVVGVDPTREAKVSRRPKQVVAGRFVQGPGEVVLGTGVAGRLRVKPGDEVVVLSTAADGSIASAAWTVVGTLSTGISADDGTLAWIALDEAESTWVLDGAHEVIARLDDPDQADAVAASLDALPGWSRVKAEIDDTANDPEATRTPAEADATVVVRTWKAVNPMLSDMAQAFTGWNLIGTAVLLITAGMGATNTLLMSVMERTRELGVLMAVGLKPRHVVALVTLESVALGAAATAIGLLLGAGLCGWLAVHGIDLSAGFGDIAFAGIAIEPKVKAVSSVGAFAWPTVLLGTVTLLASLLPAWHASRLDPVEAIGRR